MRVPTCRTRQTRRKRPAGQAAGPSLLEVKFMRLFEAVAKVRRQPVPPWEPQYRFHSTRKWRFDFAWPDEQVAVELEGGTFARRAGQKSRHTSGSGHHGDCEKYNAAAIGGWCVLRYTAKHLQEPPVQVCRQVLAAILLRREQRERDRRVLQGREERGDAE